MKAIKHLSVLIYGIAILICIVFFNISYANEVLWVGVDLKGAPCMAKKIYHGKIFDYRKDRGPNLAVVEEYHFTRNVQNLRKGNTGYILGDIHYTLEAFPNHYKALNSLIYYQLIYQSDIKKGVRGAVKPSVECYFKRAISFFPDDANVEILYAVYLKKIKRYKMADKHYQKAIDKAPENLKYRYIYGLFLIKEKKYSLAKKEAEIIYSKGFSGQKLKQKLIDVGVWNE